MVPTTMWVNFIAVEPKWVLILINMNHKLASMNQSFFATWTQLIHKTTILHRNPIQSPKLHKPL